MIGELATRYLGTQSIEIGGKWSHGNPMSNLVARRLAKTVGSNNRTHNFDLVPGSFDHS